MVERHVSGGSRKSLFGCVFHIRAWGLVTVSLATMSPRHFGEKKWHKSEWKRQREKLPFRRTRGLGLRLMGYFILYGLLMGVLVYGLTALVDTRSLIRDLGLFVAEELHQDSENRGGKGKGLTHDEKLHRALTTLRKKFPSNEEGLEVFLFSRKGSLGWMELSPGPEGQVICQKAPPALGTLLDSVAKKGKGARGFQSDRGLYEALISIPAREPGVTYGVRFLVHRQAIWNRILEDKNLLLGFGILLVVFGVVLGGFFARRLTYPLTELSEAALRFAQGDYHHRNRVTQHDELGFLGKTLNFMAEKVDKHIQEIEYRSRTMEAMNRIDKTVLGSLFDPKVVDLVAEIVAGFLGSGAVVLAIPDEKARVYRLSVFQSQGGPEDIVPHREVPFDGGPETHPLSTRGFEEIRVVGQRGLPHELGRFVSLSEGTLLHAPLMGSTGYQGSCLVVDPQKSGYSGAEKEAIRMLADQVGVAMQNARVYREKEDLLLEILLSLTRAIDAKSRWTGGHSGRVAEFALTLGRAAGLNETELDRLKMSGHLHDIGKLATPESILDKPGSLTPEEYAVIQKHPEDGARIVGPVDAQDLLVPGILHHHERWDGKGYPGKLAGEEIPLQARILCIADVWDAISADRPYRSGMPLEKAVAFMEANKGQMFDPRLLDLFIKSQTLPNKPSPSRPLGGDPVGVNAP